MHAPNRKASAAGWALLSLAISILGNDLLGDYVSDSGLPQGWKEAIAAGIDIISWIAALIAVIKLLRKGPDDAIIDLLKDACGGIVPLIQEALVWGAIADTSATLAFGFGTGKYDGAT